MNDFNRSFQRQHNFITTFIYIVFAVLILGFIAVVGVAGYIGFQAFSLDWSHGLQGVLQTIWQGK